ncbi:MAG TPA: hypothetical protein PKD56_10245, partial [Chitinophagales bacterium]|nr:hypothetical protein [Chitinophagales bacterium]
RYTVAATDQNSDVLTYTLTQSPAGMTIDTFGRITWLTPPRTTQQGQLNGSGFANSLCAAAN